MKTYSFILFLLIGISLLFSGCKKDEEKAPLQIPAVYDGSNYTANTTTEYQIRQQLKNLSAEMKKGRTAGTVLNATTLHDLFNSGTMSLSSITTPEFKTSLQILFDELAAASGGTFDPDLAPSQNGNGGVYGGTALYLFDENGLEIEQIVEKGLFGAALYHFAVTRYLNVSPTLEKLDKALALYGAHPDFPNSNKAANHANPDEFLAGYAARRDDGSGSGVYLSIKKNFIKAQAAIKAGDDYRTELNEAIAAIKLNWEKAFAATGVYYCFDAIAKLSATAPNPTTKAGALHSISEAAAFFYGLKHVPDKKISDSSIDTILSKLKCPENETASLHEFIKNPVQAVTDIGSVIDLIQSVYGFSDAEIESFKLNQVDLREP